MAKSRSNQLHHKKRTAQSSFSRKGTDSKTPRKRFLIVCEGEVTEPDYFKAFRKDLGLTSVDVEIYGEECGSSPNSVYEYTKEMIKKDVDYDRAYCVFDRDKHDDNGGKYTQTIQEILKNPKYKGIPITAINSVPCF